MLSGASSHKRADIVEGEMSRSGVPGSGTDADGGTIVKPRQDRSPARLRAIRGLAADCPSRRLRNGPALAASRLGFRVPLAQPVRRKLSVQCEMHWRSQWRPTPFAFAAQMRKNPAEAKGLTQRHKVAKTRKAQTVPGSVLESTDRCVRLIVLNCPCCWESCCHSSSRTSATLRLCVES